MPFSVDCVSPLNEHSSCAPSSFPVPPHLMGRNVDNPTISPACARRRPQKPRFGVRIPHRHLTSQIVTQEEIAQEILHRAMKKNASSPSPSAVAENPRASGGESVFALRLSRHLANRLSSPNKDVEVICNRNTAEIRAKVQAELNDSGMKPDVDFQGSPSASNQPIKEVQRGGDACAASSPTSSLSPRIHLPLAKLDKDVEREMALKQLKELPMIKGRCGELTGDSHVFRSSRRSLDYSIPSSFKTKDVEEDDKKSGHGNNCAYQCSLGNPVIHLHKLNEFYSAQNQDQVLPNHIQVNSNSQFTPVICSEVKNMEKTIQCKYAKTDKVFPKESKLRINKKFKTNLTNGHCAVKMRKIKKRRSARLSIVLDRNELNPLLTKDNLSRKKTGQKKKHKVNPINANGTTVLEGTGEVSEKEHPCFQGSCSKSSLQGECISKLLPELNIKQINALKDDTDLVVHISRETKDWHVSEGEKESFENCSHEADRGSEEPEKSSPFQRNRELDRLLMDEGAINMILSTSPLVGNVVRPRRKNSNKKLIRAINKESISLKQNLAKKHVLHDIISSSKPKLRLMKEKSEIEVIDLTQTSPRKLSPFKVMTPTLQDSADIKQHSPSDSVLISSKNPPAKETSDCSNFDSKNSGKKTSPPKSNISNKEIPFVKIKCMDIAQMKTPLISNKQNNMHRYSSVKKPVTVPRMSNSVRLKLNTEMSKNFLRGLNLENATVVPPKTLKTKRSCDTPLKRISPPDQVKSIVSKNENSMKINSRISKSESDVESMKILNGKDLSVCLTKLEDNNEVPFNSVHDSHMGTRNNAHVIPEALPASSIVSTAMSSELPTAAAKVISKVKKPKDTNARSFKNLIDKEHGILTVPLSPIASSYSSITKGLKNVSPKHKKKSSKLEKQMESKETKRYGWRQNAGTFSYKEIHLRRYENFVQIILAPCSTVMKNSFNVQVLHEFQDALQQLRRDRFCKVVLVTSTGSTFCQGVDLHSLIHVNIEHRKKAAEQLSKALKDFLKTLAMFNKPIIAGVQGASVGLGVTMLPFFDVVYASDKATFHTPYARLGQVPEGAAVLTFPLLLGNALTSELLFGSRKLTAMEAVHHGLVTRVLWPDKFQEELIPNVETIANQSSQAMESIKALLRLNLRVKLDATLDSESSLLIQHWSSPECQRNFRKFLDTSDDVLFQRQKKDRS